MGARILAGKPVVPDSDVRYRVADLGICRRLFRAEVPRFNRFVHPYFEAYRVWELWEERMIAPKKGENFYPREEITGDPAKFDSVRLNFVLKSETSTYSHRAPETPQGRRDEESLSSEDFAELEILHSEVDSSEGSWELPKTLPKTPPDEEFSEGRRDLDLRKDEHRVLKTDDRRRPQDERFAIESVSFYVGVHEGNRPCGPDFNYRTEVIADRDLPADEDYDPGFYSWSQRIAMRQSGRHFFLVGWNPGEERDGFGPRDWHQYRDDDRLGPGGKMHFQFRTVEEAVKLRQAFARYPEFVDDFSESEEAAGTRPDSAHIGAVLWKNVLETPGENRYEPGLTLERYKMRAEDRYLGRFVYDPTNTKTRFSWPYMGGYCWEGGETTWLSRIGRDRVGHWPNYFRRSTDSPWPYEREWQAMVWNNRAGAEAEQWKRWVERSNKGESE